MGLTMGNGVSMEPIEETVEAAEEFGPFGSGDVDLLDHLRELGDRTRGIVPDCIGLSLAVQDYGLTFTLVASAEEIAVLDALQYLSGGPCVAAAAGESVLEYTHDELMDEDDWQLFARAGAAMGVQSTLSLPIVVDGRVGGSVNLYGASRSAFTGHHEELAEVFGAWAPGAVTNADLGFATREEARRAPQQAKDEITLSIAVGVWAEREGLDSDAARVRLDEAARRAQVDTLQLAQTLVSLYSGAEGDLLD